MYFFSKLVCNFFKTLACVAGGIVGFRAHKQKRRSHDSERRSREWLGEEKLTPPSSRLFPLPHPLPFSFFLSPVSPLFARSKWRPVVRNRCFRIIPPAKPPALQATKLGTHVKNNIYTPVVLHRKMDLTL